jgi:hypothetical protein
MDEKIVTRDGSVWLPAQAHWLLWKVLAQMHLMYGNQHVQPVT